jgi:hypothetical protein
MARTRRKGRLIARFGSTALRRGLRGGSRAWLYAGVAATGFRVLRGLVGRREDVVRFRLHPGETLEIREIPRAK